MAWTPPITWADTTVYDYPDFNAQVRDNMLLLASVRDTATGRFTGLTSSTLLSLDPSNVTNLAFPGAANAWTAGRNDFSAGSTTRLVVPVGSNKYDGAPGNKTPGSLWVDGTALHHVDGTKNEWSYVGTAVADRSGVGAVAGSVWVDSADYLVHYVDASQEERKVVTSHGVIHTDAAAKAGSLWVETSAHVYLGWVGSAGRAYEAHSDFNHTDHTDHTDAAVHTDSTGSHVDSHSDTAHVDSHTDFYPAGHYDTHTDTAAHDDHTDTTPHTDHNDGHSDSTPHSDVAADHRPVSVGA